jgi:hypothetical protein
LYDQWSTSSAAKGCIFLFTTVMSALKVIN